MFELNVLEIKCFEFKFELNALKKRSPCSAVFSYWSLSLLFSSAKILFYENFLTKNSRVGSPKCCDFSNNDIKPLSIKNAGYLFL